MCICCMQRNELRVGRVEISCKSPEKTADFPLVLYSLSLIGSIAHVCGRFRGSFLGPAVLEEDRGQTSVFLFFVFFSSKLLLI